MQKKLFKQVHQSPTGFFFRLTLPVARFECEERYETAEDAAFFCDVFKLFLVRKYGLKSNTMFPSLAPTRFSELLADAGVDRASLDSLTAALPSSCTAFLLDGGNEELTKHRDNLAVMQRVIS